MPGTGSRRMAGAFRPQDRHRRARAEDAALIDRPAQRMAENRADFTNTFRGMLATADRRAISSSTRRPSTRGRSAGARLETRRTRGAMRAANPAFIPRNHRVEQMIEAAVAGDFAPFERLLAVLSAPSRGPARRRRPRPPAGAVGGGAADLLRHLTEPRFHGRNLWAPGRRKRGRTADCGARTRRSAWPARRAPAP